MSKPAKTVLILSRAMNTMFYTNEKDYNCAENPLWFYSIG